MKANQLTFINGSTTYYANYIINSGFTQREPLQGENYEKILAQVRREARANTPEGECAIYEVWHEEKNGEKKLDAAGLLNYQTID